MGAKSLNESSTNGTQQCIYRKRMVTKLYQLLIKPKSAGFLKRAQLLWHKFPTRPCSVTVPQLGGERGNTQQRAQVSVSRLDPARHGGGGWSSHACRVLGHAATSLRTCPSAQLPLSPPEPAAGPAEHT